MRRLGTVVYLKLSLPEVEGRIHNLATRGIALSPGQTLADVYDYRTPLYERCCPYHGARGGPDAGRDGGGGARALTEAGVLSRTMPDEV